MAAYHPRILVVEDEALVARDIQATLESIGYTSPDVAKDAESASIRLRDFRPDLVLMDIDLGNGDDGIALAEELAKGSDRIPVVFLTGYFDQSTIDRARKCSPFGYLTKPFDAEKLAACVEVALSRHLAERRIRERVKALHDTLNSIADGVLVTDLAGTITYVNPAAEALTGWDAGEADGRALDEVFRIALPSGQAAEPFPQPSAGKDGEAGGVGRPVLLTTKSGGLVPIEDNSAPLIESDGALAGIVIVFRRRPDSEIPSDADTSWGHLVGIVEGIDDPLFSVDSEWRFTYANRRAESYFKTGRSDLVGKRLWSVLPEALQPQYSQEFHHALLHREARTFELHDERHAHWFEVTAYPFGSGLLAFFRDVTPRKEAEAQQAKVEKLEALGLLARGFAHDFNNLLTVLVGNLANARSRVTEAMTARELDDAKAATQQAQSLVHQLLTFAKGGAPVKSPTDLGALVHRVMESHPRRANIEYAIEIADGLPAADVDPNQIERVLINLLRNAEQASVPGSTITVAIEPSGDRSVDLSVTDTGSGIPEHLRSKVLEPFFSTRAEANATGIGLTVCESIAKSHGGSIAIASPENGGTQVCIALPASKESAALPAPTEPAPVAPGGKRPRILMLEDEPLIRQLAASNLMQLGYEVVVTTDGADTVARYRQAMNNGVGPFDLLIMDLTIPGGMGGASAMEQIRSIDPAARAIVSSGYSDDPVMANPTKYGFAAVLPKPYEPGQLSTLVAEVLGEA